jgi:hypothetical protein
MPLRLWVDAVCINQADAQEQSRQVAMMAEIFSEAYRTIIWLGEDRDDNDLQIFELFQRLQDIKARNVDSQPHSDPVIHAVVASGVGRCVQSRESHFCPCGQPYLPPTMGRVWSGVNWDETLFKMLSRNQTLLELFASRTMAVACFLNRRYWTRRWILQEIRHSKALSIHWSQFEISPRMFQDIHDQLSFILLLSRQVMHRCKIDDFDMWSPQSMEPVDRTAHDAMIDLDKQLHHVRSLFSTLLRSDQYPEWNIERLLSLFNELECSDPRDRLFSMLNIARLNWITPDYDQSTVKAYTALAKGLIERGRAEVVFRNVNRFLPADDISASLPSWVPDLRERFHDHRHDEKQLNITLDNQRYDGSHSYINFDGNGRLMATLFFLGTVTNFGNPTDYFDLISNPKAKPRLGVFQRRAIKRISHKVRFRNHYMPPNSMLRPGDILCTSRGQLPEILRETSIEGVILFLRRTDPNEDTYKVVYSPNIYLLDTEHWDRTSKRTRSCKITLQLV